MKMLPSKIKDSSLIADSYECVEGNDSYLLLSGGFCGEDEFMRERHGFSLLYYEIFNILSINSDTDLTQPSAYCFTVAGE